VVFIFIGMLYYVEATSEIYAFEPTPPATELENKIQAISTEQSENNSGITIGVFGSVPINEASTNALREKGIQLAESRVNGKALKVLNRILQTEPENAATLGYKGLALSHLGRYEDAIIFLNMSVAIDPNNPEIKEEQYATLLSLQFRRELETTRNATTENQNMSNMTLLGSSTPPNQGSQGSSSESTKTNPTSNQTASGPQSTGTEIGEEFTVQMPASEGGATYNMLRLPDGTVCEKDYNCTEVIASSQDQQDSKLDQSGNIPPLTGCLEVVHPC
jgi:Tetratricopeptide repeat